MGPSTNTPFVIFLAFTMNNGDTEDDFYDFNDFYELPSSVLSFCCHYNEQQNMPADVSFKNVLPRYLGSRMVGCAM